MAAALNRNHLVVGAVDHLHRACIEPLLYFPYAAQGDGKPSETLECAICLEPLRPGQLCREVQPCRHVFHSDGLGKAAATQMRLIAQSPAKESRRHKEFFVCGAKFYILGVIFF